MKRKTVSKIFAAAAAAAVLTASLAGCGKEESAVNPEYVEQLESECVDLRNQNQDLENQLGDLEQTVVLKSYTLKAQSNAAGDGAVVAITAAPMRYEEGQKAVFRVSLDGQEIATEEAVWDGSAYTGSVELKAEDGYAYECILTQANGSENSIVISSPEVPLYESCVFLASSLNAYCNLFVEDWVKSDNKLVLTTGYAQVQLPKIGGQSVSYSSSDLVLKQGDAEIGRVPVEMPQGEAEGSYEIVLQEITFDMPELEDGQSLDLWLEVNLEGGSALTYNGCSWFMNQGELTLVVG